jgi:hypothetical protein
MALGWGNTIHVAWEDNTPGNEEIYYKRSTDGGATWGVSTRLTWTSNTSRRASIAVDSNGNILVIWQELISGNEEVFCKRSTNGGATWTAATRLTWTSGISSNPVMATDSSNGIHIVWQDYTTGGPEIYYKKSTDGGATWTTVKRLTWLGSSSDPAIAIGSSDSVHLLWTDSHPAIRSSLQEKRRRGRPGPRPPG